MIEPEDLERAQNEASSERELTELLARQYGVPAIDLSTRTISSEVVMLVPNDVRLRLLAVPVERHGSVLVVAFADPSNFAAVTELEELTQMDIEIVVSCETAVRSAIARLQSAGP
ncbi:MAG: hypothetical protein Q8S33_20905 [Myxococcales bacterium]|nr:hypothetical protein [Myxococcales bacterium]